MNLKVLLLGTNHWRHAVVSRVPWGICGRRRFVFALLLCAAPAFAGSFQIHQLRTMTQHTSESKVAFLVDVAHWLRHYSTDTGFEACARIAADGDRYGVVITTSKSHFGCAIDNTMLPAGMTATGDTIHSHAKNKTYVASRSDRQFLPNVLDSRRYVRVRGQDLNHFSRTDYMGGSGYLAGSTGLYYQDSPGHQSLVKAY